MSYQPSKLPEWLEGASKLALAAGEAIMEIYSRGFDVEEKNDRSPLTEADLAAHRVINTGLGKLTPDLPALSEESKQLPYSTRAQWGTYWLIDPLDGTREFIKRNDEFTVNIALVHDHEVVLGVVYAPALELRYEACRGHGAVKIDAGGNAEPIRSRPVPPECPVVVGSRSHAGDSLKTFLAALGHHELVSMGSALKSCLVADGSADVYPRFGPTSEWDTAAAQCVVEEAGGLLTDMSLHPLRYNTKESLLNPHFLVIGDREFDWATYL